MFTSQSLGCIRIQFSHPCPKFNSAVFKPPLKLGKITHKYLISVIRMMEHILHWLNSTPESGISAYPVQIHAVADGQLKLCLLKRQINNVSPIIKRDIRTINQLLEISTLHGFFMPCNDAVYLNHVLIIRSLHSNQKRSRKKYVCMECKNSCWYMFHTHDRPLHEIPKMSFQLIISLIPAMFTKHFGWISIGPSPNQFKWQK